MVQSSRNVTLDFANNLKEMLPAFIQTIQVVRNDIVVFVSPQYLVPVLTFLRDHTNTRFRSIMNLSGVDYPNRELRFEVVYNLLSVTFAGRIRVKVCSDEASPVPSVVDVYSAANYFEREAWDMFGIYFSNHPDLRRILTDYGFEGFPLRKDFPLSGYTEVRYDEAQKRVVCEPIEVSQEFRNYNFESPWQQIV